jgi:hypothetical protein
MKKAGINTHDKPPFSNSKQNKQNKQQTKQTTNKTKT